MNKLVLISMVKNESDIIESFIRHHLNIVDEMIIVDHNSCDSTKQILECLHAEGLPIHIKTDYRVEQAQSEIMTSLMYEAIKKYGADIVVPLDADEFLVNIETEENCRTILQNIDSNGVYAVDSINYFPSLDDKTELFLPWRPCYRAREKQKDPKVIVGRKVIEDFHVSLLQGNHDIGISKRKKKLINYSCCNLFQIAHFQVRSREQFVSKVSVGWIGNLARHNKTLNQASHWKAAFEKIKHGMIISEDEIIKMVSGIDIEKKDLEYASLKKHCQYSQINYADLIAVDPFINLLYTSESLAAEYAHNKAKERNIYYLTKMMIKSIKEGIQYIYFRKVRGITHWQ